MSRLKKMYVRDKDGVFRAIEGFEYGETMVFVDLSVYTYTRSEDHFSFITLQKKRKEIQ